MSYKATVIELFLSSPDDVRAERDFVIRTAAEWNQLRGRETACFISILTWEDMVAPALMERSQEVINHQIGGAYDVYLGIMWTRFGTPTGLAQSGTEEEFLAALERAKGGHHVRIATMFKTGDIALANVDALQLHKVQQFKKMVSEEGGFYREFSDLNSLRSALNLLFQQISKDQNVYNVPVQRPSTSSATDDSQKRAVVSEKGLFEIGEEFTIEISKFTEHLKEIMEAENEHTVEVSQCSSELSQINNAGFIDKGRVRTIFRRVSASMDTLADRYAGVEPGIEVGSRQIADLIDADLSVRFRVEDWQRSASENLKAASDFSIMLDNAILQLRTLSDATTSIPPLSGQVNLSKSRLEKERRKLIEIFVSLKESVDNSVKFFG